MEKREFIKTFCGLGMCGCAASLAAPLESQGATDDQTLDEAKAENSRLNWRLDLARRQFSTLLKKIEPEVSPEVRREIMREMGRNCAKALGWAEKYKGDPEGFFEFMKNRLGEDLSFDDAKKKITIVTPERPCVCPIVDHSSTPGYYCDCSLGWQIETYETILGVKVDAEVKESSLWGNKRCVFEVVVLEEVPEKAERG